MLRLTVCLATFVNLVLSDPLPSVAAAAPAIGQFPSVPGYVPPVFGRSSAYSGFNGYRSPYYNPASATAPIISYSNNRGIDGSYSFSYATGDGKQAQESGFLKDAYIDNTGSPQGTQVVEGSYAYTSPEGTPIQVNYVADENGFRPAGVHIPAVGKGVTPTLLGNGIANRNIYDPRYNAYNPANYLNQYNYNQYNPLRPYDARYNLYNPHHTLKDVKKSL